MPQNILLGIDEMTLVLHAPMPVDSKEWPSYAEDYISRFLSLSRIAELFGQLIPMTSRLPAGYTRALMVDHVPWYLAIAYHEHFQKMGVCIKFSAEAWAWYQKRFAEQHLENMNAAIFYQRIQSELYLARISRIDLTADYFDFGDELSPHEIHKCLLNEAVRVADCNDRVANRKISAYENNGIVQTLVIGSKKENTKSLLRIYDKKIEQTEKNGFRLKEAMSCESWTRFEASYRGDYAHQIGAALLSIGSEAELSSFIAAKIADKYRFLNTGTAEYTDYTNDLLHIAESSNANALRSENPQNNSLQQSIDYLKKGSGLFPTLYKIEQIWGADATIELWEYLYLLYKTEFEPDAKKDLKLKYWLDKNRQSLQEQQLSDCF